MEKALNNFKLPQRRGSVKLNASGDDAKKYGFFPSPLSAFPVGA